MRGNTARDEPWRQAHVDIGGLAERVTGTERQIGSLAEQVGNLQRDTAQQIGSLSAAVAAQMQGLGEKIDRQQQSYNASRATNWSSFAQSSAAIIGVIMTIGAAVIIPINANVSRHDEAIEKNKATHFGRDDALEMRSEIAHWIDKVQLDGVTRTEFAQYQATVAETVKRLDERATILLPINKERIDRLDKEIDHLQSDAVSRIENESASRRTDERISAVVGSMNELRHDFGSSLTWGDALKEVQSEIKELRLQAAGVPAAIAAPKPAD